jgi:hypothetical protein
LGRAWNLKLGTWNWRSPYPNKHFAILIDRDTFCVNQFSLEVFERLVVESKLALQRSIRDTAFTLKESTCPLNDFVEFHSFTRTFIGRRKILLESYWRILPEKARERESYQLSTIS